MIALPFLWLAGSAVCLPLHRAVAQEGSLLPDGARIRWRFEGDRSWSVGTVQRAHFDTVFAQQTDERQVVKLLAGDLQELDLSQGMASRGRGAFKGGRIGLIAGLGAALVGSLATCCFCGKSDSFSPGNWSNKNCIGMGGAAAIALGGTALGAIMGARLPTQEDWVKLSPSRLQVGVLLGPRQLGVRLSLLRR